MTLGCPFVVASILAFSIFYTLTSFSNHLTTTSFPSLLLNTTTTTTVTRRGKTQKRFHQQCSANPNVTCTPPVSAINLTTGAAILPERFGVPHAADIAPVEHELTKLLHEESERVLQEVVPRARSPVCKQLLKDRASHMRRTFERSFPRHELAERACPIDLLAQFKDASQIDMPWEAQPPQSLHDISNNMNNDNNSNNNNNIINNNKLDATLAFSIQLSQSTNLMQLGRLLSKIVRPQHVYHFSIDAQPDVRSRHGGSLNNLLGSAIERIMTRLGPVAYMNISTTVDVVYTGTSLLSAYIMSWHTLLRDEVPAWDFLINISPSDYPIKSVDYMARVLAQSGPVSHTESFLQLPTYANGRSLRSWFFECPSEPCGDHNAPKWDPEPFQDPDEDDNSDNDNNHNDDNGDNNDNNNDNNNDDDGDDGDIRTTHGASCGVSTDCGESAQSGRPEMLNNSPEVTRRSKRRSVKGRNMAASSTTSSAASSSSSPSSACSGYVFWLPSSRKPPMEKSREFGGSAFATLHHSFVHYTYNCLIGNDTAASAARQKFQSIKTQQQQQQERKGGTAKRLAHDVAYCKSIRGMYRWYATSFSPEETFVQTALFNGPFCHKTKSGNMRWVAWSGGDKDCGRGKSNPLESSYNQNDYQSRRPTCITAHLAKMQFSPPPPPPPSRRRRTGARNSCKTCDVSCMPSSSLRNQLFARKFHLHIHSDAYEAADTAASQWDQLCLTKQQLITQTTAAVP